jgi:hypothetical protein
MTPYPTDADFAGPAEEALAEQLRRIAIEADPVPELVLESARAALSLRRLDAELAEMVHDSDIDGVAAVRGPADDAEGNVRLLSFEAPGMSISAQISTSATTRSLLGQVAGAQATSVALQTPRDEYLAELADAGMFRLDHLPAGPVRLVVATANRAVVGDWITI